MNQADDNFHFSVDGFAHNALRQQGTVIRVERTNRASVHGGGYVVGTSKGIVGQNYVGTTHVDQTSIWITLEDGKEDHVRINQDVPVREGHTIQLLRISGHYVVRTTGYDTRDRPIIEKASNLLVGLRIVETGKVYACRDLKAAIAYEEFYASTGRLFLWSFLWMPAMGAGLAIWAWLIVRSVLLRFGSTLYGVPMEVSKRRWEEILGTFEKSFEMFSAGHPPKFDRA